MATQNFNGTKGKIDEGNDDFAEVTINFDDRTARFHYPYGNPKLKEKTEMNYFTFPVIILIIIAIIGAFAMLEAYEHSDITMAKEDFGLETSSLITMLVISGSVIGASRVLSKKTKKYSPEIEAYSRFFSWKRKKVYKMHSLMYTIPEFSNILLKYRLFGDFKKFIRKIETKLKDFDGETWYANIYFDQIPKKGRMELVYV